MARDRFVRQTSRTRVFLAAAAGLPLMLAGACASGAGSAADDVLKVGILAPQSGALAEDGTAYTDAARAALDAAAHKSGRDIEIAVYDEASQTAEAVTGTRRLIQREEVDVLLSGSTSGNFLATRQLIVQAEIPVLTIATATAVVENNTGWTFRVSQPLPDRIDDNAKFAIEELEAKTAAFLQVNDETQRAFVKDVRAKLTAANVDVVSQQYFQYGDNDFSPYLQKLRSAAPDVTFLGCEVSQCATILEQAHATGITTKFMLPTAASSKDFLTGFGKVSEGAYVQTIYAPGAVEDTAEFEQIAQEKGFPASYYSIIGYSEAAVLAQAAQQAGSTEPQAIRDALADGTFDSPLGEITFLDNGQAAVSGYVAQISEGNYVRVWPETGA